MKKILIVSVSAGSGHVSAAKALEAEAGQSYPNITVKHMDLVDYISRTSRKIFFESYELIAAELPKLWGFFYKSIDVPKRQEQFDKLTSVLKKIQSSKFINAINEFEPDYILGTHFTPVDAIRLNREKINKKFRLGVVVTDYGLHQLWITCAADDYFVATDKMKWKLLKTGGAKNVIKSGIPIDPVFFEEKNLIQLSQKLNCDPNKKTVLVLSGGQGISGIKEIVEALCESDEPINVFAIAGNSKRRLDKLQSINPPENIKITSIGWTDKIDDYMRIADVVVSKSGGLTTTEVTALNKPFIVLNPIPGQEERNAEYILENGFGKVAHTVNDLLYYLTLPGGQLAPGYKTQKPPKAAAKIILDYIITYRKQPDHPDPRGKD